MTTDTVSLKDEYYRYYFRALRLALLIGTALFGLGYFIFGLWAGIAAGLIGVAVGYDRVMDSYHRVVALRSCKDVRRGRLNTFRDDDDGNWLNEMNKSIDYGPHLADDFDPRNPSDPFGVRS